MGNQQLYIPEGGFNTELYRDHPGFGVVEVNGVRGKAIYHIDDPNGEHFGLPMYAGISDVYFRINENGEAVQAKLYADRRMVLDFDWDHSHTNKKTGEHFPESIIHVQEYYINNKGEIKRNSNKARYMTEAEIKKYGPLIHAFNPNVKFR